ncbi:hypothetical protein RAZWK3B_20646 [Roseobacter sp. AzwK-3b]|uniref:hypothetical protein n=1 Tax=Roseobacter sp. AzwK-3b TaxID=351016 RepID=UPI0001569C1C|nr:hypothetical protein [Roseobacter sp. AzwK-3b]EDM71800.1 hypothetical protein RAZWK3B_20646 [Roseobacter sp. AzwK-3b]
MTPEGLSEKAGVPKHHFRKMIIKELIDNACDVGGGRLRLVNSDLLEFHDNGPGIPLEALSIKRPLVSSKHWRLGERGALGNGLRAVMGALYCLGGHLVIHANGKATKVLIGDDGETNYIDQGEAPDTKVQVYCDEIGNTPDLLSFKLTEQMAGPVVKSSKAIPEWFDDEAILDIQRSAEGLTAGEIVRQFRTGYEPSNPDELFTEVDAVDLLAKMQKHTLERTPKVRDVGPGLMPGWEYAQLRGERENIPYVVEAWVEATPKGSGNISVEILITNRAISLTSVNANVQKKGRLNIETQFYRYQLPGSDRDKFTLGQNVDYRAVLSISSPYFPIISSGKAVDLDHYVNDLMRVLSKAGKKAKSALNKRKPKEKRITIKDAVEQLLPDAYEKVSEGGRYWANARQLMYAMRPEILRICKIDKFDDATVTQKYLPRFQRPEWKIAYDKRGALEEPHTGQTVGLGTVEIENYRGRTANIGFDRAARPSMVFGNMPAEGRFNKLLFVEKEGFNQLIRESGLLERYDMAMASSKGLPVVAARALIDHLAGAVDGFQLYVLADFDVNGCVLADSLVTDRHRYQFANEVDTTKLGVTWEQAQQLHRQMKSEPVELEKQNTRVSYAETLAGYGLEESAIDFLLGRHLDEFNEQPMRVELNAFTSRELLEIVDEGVSGAKVVPKDLQDLYAEASLRKRVAEYEQKLRKEPSPRPPYGLRDTIAEMLTEEPNLSWDEVLARLV